MRHESYKKSLGRLLVANADRHVAFVRGLKELEDSNSPELVESTVRSIVAALERLIETPELSNWPFRVSSAKAETLLLCLGFRSARADGFYAFEGRKTPAVLGELRLAVDALRDFKPRPKPPTKQLKPEPALGASGTTSVLLVVGKTAHRRRFEADDLLKDVVEWAETITHKDAPSLTATAPASELTLPQDERKTLQALGFWPGVTLRLVEEEEEDKAGVASKQQQKKKEKKTTTTTTTTPKKKSRTKTKRTTVGRRRSRWWAAIRLRTTTSPRPRSRRCL
mmetsp:Transcript_31518/g.101202  ORF Transcript_31518/g.101202 Transcript_31518/m.101202 type:complete len:281 (-) Transcript_31518:1012-1854(-)